MIHASASSNSHLASGRREQDTHKRNKVGTIRYSSALARSTFQYYLRIANLKFPSGRGVFDHDAVIWLGDLNYRLNTQWCFEDVVTLCNTNRYLELTEHDELREQQRQGLAFTAFQESELNFPPTYKYDVGTNDWDTSGKQRVPAWCDRILWWTSDQERVQLRQSDYMSIGDVRISDHKPVCAALSMQVRTIDEVARLEVLKELLGPHAPPKCTQFCCMDDRERG